MTIDEQIIQLFALHIETSMALADQVVPKIVSAGQCVADRLLAGGKVLVCAHGHAFSNGLHFVQILLHGQEEGDRPPLPAMLLGTNMIGAEEHPDQVYAREIQALGQEQDVVLLLSAETKTIASTLVQAAIAAKEKNIPVIVLTNLRDEILTGLMRETDQQLQIGASSTMLTLVLQLIVLNGLSEVIDYTIFRTR